MLNIKNVIQRTYGYAYLYLDIFYPNSYLVFKFSKKRFCDNLFFKLLINK